MGRKKYRNGKAKKDSGKQIRNQRKNHGARFNEPFSSDEKNEINRNQGGSMKSPAVVLWNFTYWCNMKCLHCYSRIELGKSPREINTEDAKMVVKQLVEAKVLHVNFGGGESLGRPDFFEIAKEVATHKIGISLSTNGWLVDEGATLRLKEIGTKSVSVSFHGATAEVHDKFHRCFGAFNKAEEAVKELVKAGIYTKMAVTVSQYNVNSIENIANLAEKLKVNELVLQSLKIPPGGVVTNEMRKNLLIHPKRWKRLLEKFYNMKKKFGKGGLEITLDFLNDPLIAKAIGIEEINCSCGKLSCVIKPNGDLVPCAFVNIPAGNILQTPLINLWENSIIFKEIRSKNLNPCCAIPEKI